MEEVSLFSTQLDCELGNRSGVSSQLLQTSVAKTDIGMLRQGMGRRKKLGMADSQAAAAAPA